MGGARRASLTFANNPPTVVMMVGLQGAGKTTNVAKLAGLLQAGRASARCSPPATSTVPRPSTQLQVVGGQLGIPVFEMGQVDPVEIARRAPSTTPRTTATTSSFWTPPAASTSTRQLMDELQAHQGRR